MESIGSDPVPRNITATKPSVVMPMAVISDHLVLHTL